MTNRLMVKATTGAAMPGTTARLRRGLRAIVGSALITAVSGMGIVAIASAAGASPTYNWTPHHSITSPPQRTSAAMAYDGTTNDIVLFGGVSEGAPLDTTWNWNGSSWVQEQPATSPSARTGASMAYDPVSKQLVLFGGTAGSTPTSTTWVWSGSDWSEKTTGATTPAARTLASMAYDPNLGGVVLFGGSTATGDVSTLWLWKDTAWQTITPSALTQRPPARTTAAMVYDPATKQLVAFGGYDDGPIGTTWVLEGPTWTESSPNTKPSPRFGAAMAYDATEGSVVLFGGASSSTPMTTTWLWTGTNWDKQSPQTHPPAQSGGSMAYDTSSGELVLLNGVTGHPTWTWEAESVLNVPGKPVNVSAVAGTTSAVVSWTAPGSDGGTAITDYVVTSSPGTQTCTSTTTTTCTISGLDNGTTYHFTVRAVNGVGKSTPSTASNAVVPSGKPFAPTDVTATPATLAATVSWAAATDNGAAIDTYDVTSSPGTQHCTTSKLTCTVSTLEDDVAYRFTVVATNSNGAGATSTPSATLTLAGKPFAPSGVSAARANHGATVSWTAPTTNGGVITGYTVASTPSGHGCTAPANTRSCTVNGLTNGTSYKFSVTATNKAGTSASSIPVTVVPATVPFAPKGVKTTRGDHQVKVTWTAATANGTAVTKYTVTSAPDTQTCSTTGALSCTVTGLSNGVRYSFTVVATNGVGQSVASTPSPTVVPATSPKAPTGVQVEGGNGQVLVSWTAATDGGTPVNGYTVTSAPGTLTCTTKGTLSCTVTGLTNGTSYTFTVVAANGIGSSTPSKASATVVPAGPPRAPVGAAAVRGDHTVAVSWDAATPDGSAVTAYSVVSKPTGGSCRTTGALGCTVTGLTNGVSYTFSVKASNIVGTSEASTPSNVAVPAGAPFTPPSLSAIAGTSSVVLSWSAATDNGSAVTNYVVLRGTSSSLQVLATTTTTSYTDTSAVPGTIYSYALEAVNVIGTSTATTSVTAEVDPPGGTGAHVGAMPDGQGYWLVTATGAVTAFGRAQLHGSLHSVGVTTDNIVGIASTADGGGYWIVGANGGVYAFGDAVYFGSLPQVGVSVDDVLGIVPTATGLGYWIYGADGGIFSFGDAQFHGSTGGLHLNKPVVGMAAAPTGGGYWLVASDGGVFCFGTAAFHGSTGSIHLNQPIVAMAPAHTGSGYWLVASDGGIFAFNAPFFGSTGGSPPPAPVIGMLATPTGSGYTVVDAIGTGFRFPMP